MFQRFLTVLALVILLVAASLAGEFHEAVRTGDLAQVQRLLDRDASLAGQPDADSQFQDLPLHIAARQGHVEVARALLTAGVDVNAGDQDESTALDVAAISRQHGMLVFLLDNGADMNHRDNNGAYSLSFAMSAGAQECVDTLLARGVDAENVRLANGTTLFHLAVRSGNTDLSQGFLDSGTDVNERSGRGQTALHWAAGGTHPEMIDWLLERGADPRVIDNEGESPLMTACWRQRVESARALLAHDGLDVDMVSGHGWGPLGTAALNGNAELLQLILAQDPDVNQRFREGRTALSMATLSGNIANINALLDAGACPDRASDWYDRTPLHDAAARGFGDVTKAFLAHGACPDARDLNGDSPLALATRHGHAGVATMLAAAAGKRVNTEKACQSATACNQGQGHACNRASLAAQPRPGQGEAVAWYCGHAGWTVLTRDHVLIFDYWERNRQADEPGLACGCIRPEELEGREVVVFVSHGHGDHWWPGVMEWRSQLDDITYVFGFQPENVEGYEFVEPREQYRFGDVKVTTTRSTDAGVGFVVDVDDVTVFHAGDHHNRAPEIDGIYREDIDWLAAAGVSPDLVFLPISGCGFGDLVPVHAGVDYTLKTLKPAVFSPMHGGDNSRRYHDFVAARRDEFPGVRMVPATDRGDRIMIGGKVVSTR